ncbi:MAG: ABC transporter permease [Bryobacteraceae bacterium]|nr:ABC transporter permease [Bryobacteraceae bacterium]
MAIEEAGGANAHAEEARRRFGNRAAISESAYDAWSLGAVESFAKDVRYAVRGMLRNPVPTGVALLSIALGIGATSVVFTAVRSVLLEPLPYQHPEELVQFRTEYPRFPEQPRGDWMSWEDAQEVRRRNRTLEGVAVYRNAFVDLASGSDHPPEALYGARVTSNLFPLLGVTPMLGRGILPEEDQPGHPDVIILSHQVWVRRFNSDPSIIGRVLTVNGHGSRVIGVMAAEFNFPMRRTAVRTPSPTVDFWAPLEVARAGGHSAVARLKQGVTLAQARQDLVSIGDSLAVEFPATNRDRVLQLNFVSERVAGNAKSSLYLLLAASVLFMLIGCSNVANLLLARGHGRQKEIALRLALGAGSRRILRQSFTESCVLAVMGGLAGYLVTVMAWQILPALAPAGIPRLAFARPDTTVLVFSIALAVLNGILFGLVPALRAIRSESANAGGFGARGIAGGNDGTRSLLVAAEVALTVTLVVLGGQLLGAFSRLVVTDPGFDSDHVLASVILPSAERYPDAGKRGDLYRKILQSVRELPGVESAGAVDALPFSGENNGALVTTTDASSAKDVTAEIDTTGGEYLQTLGLRLLEGRYFHPHEIVSSNESAIVSTVLASRLWPGSSAIGRRICLNCQPGQTPVWKRVVGVVSDAKHAALNEPEKGAVYLAAGAMERSAFVVVRTRRSVGEVERAIRRAVSAIDANQAVFLVAPLRSFIADSVADQRFVLILIFIAGCLALVLSAAGIYGVVSYSTSRRTAEIGIRMAIGATPNAVHWLVFRQGFGPAAVGLAIGMALTIGFLILLRGVLPGLDQSYVDYALAAVGMVTTTTAAACWFPARKAIKIDPALALRHD